MITVTFTRPAAVFMWALLGLFGKRRYCQSCGERVTPRTVGAFKKLEGGTTGVYHESLPCILAADIFLSSSISGRSVDEVNHGR